MSSAGSSDAELSALVGHQSTQLAGVEHKTVDGSGKLRPLLLPPSLTGGGDASLEYLFYWLLYSLLYRKLLYQQID